MNAIQPELFNSKSECEPKEIEWFVELLRGQDWQTAKDILGRAQIPDCDQARRRLRLLASRSNGRIAGGQQGYKLVSDMTSKEYQNFRNWMSHQAQEMERRIVASDRTFYARKPVHPDNGILCPGSTTHE